MLLESFWACGWIVAALIAYFVIPAFGWRAAFIIGAIPALYALYLRRAIQDSPRYMELRSQKLKFGERTAVVWSTKYRRSTLVLWNTVKKQKIQTWILRLSPRKPNHLLLIEQRRDALN